MICVKVLVVMIASVEHTLQPILDDWLALEPRPMEAQAAHKDFKGIFALAPANPGNISTVRGKTYHRLKALQSMVSQMKGFLRDKLLPAAAHWARNAAPLVSPFMGGLTPPDEDDYKESCTLSSIKIAALNPGRTGFTALGNEEIIWWRLWHISEYLTKHQVLICVLPSPRWPPGASLPPGIGFEWVGIQTKNWQSVGMLIAKELYSTSNHG